jgi:hypothetical protein
LKGWCFEERRGGGGDEKLKKE